MTEGVSVESVFDTTVVERGRNGDYNLTPVVGKSGVAGEDVKVEEVDEPTESQSGGGNQSMADGNRSAGANQSGSGGS